MYRQNKLKEELDKLRLENYRLRNEITFWKERCNTYYSEITALRFELQNRDLMGRLITKETLEPRIITLDEHGGFDGSWANSEEGKKKIKELKEMLYEEGIRITFTKDN